MCDAATIMRITLQMWRRSRVARASQQVMQDNGDLWVSGGGAATAPPSDEAENLLSMEQQESFCFFFLCCVEDTASASLTIPTFITNA